MYKHLDVHFCIPECIKEQTYRHEKTKMQTQILLQVLWYYAYSILERLKEEKKYAGPEDPLASPRSINQNLSAHMYH